MASLSRPFVRVAARSFSTTTTTTTTAAIRRQALCAANASRRYYSSHQQAPKQSSSSSSSSGQVLYFGGAAVVAAAGAGGLGYWYYQTSNSVAHPTKADYQKVYNEIASRLEEKDDYDDGSFGPVLLRLAWHASGTYDKATGTGGSNGATMRFKPESAHGANAGLVAARDFLEPVKAKFPWISYSDLWILAGVCAIQEMQGPIIPYRPGRADGDMAACTPDGRLPDATQGHDHLRSIFYRMGFNDQEIVALSGAHALGRCHRDRSGFEGPWTFSPTVLTNDYFRLLVEEKWQVKKWDGPKQFEDKTTKSLMMLPTDMALVQDKSFRRHVERYAKSADDFLKDFSAVVLRLFELGVPFEAGTESQRFTLKPTWDESK